MFNVKKIRDSFEEVRDSFALVLLATYHYHYNVVTNIVYHTYYIKYKLLGLSAKWTEGKCDLVPSVNECQVGASTFINEEAFMLFL